MYSMRTLDMDQHGGTMNVYAGYGFGKKFRKAFGKVGKVVVNESKKVAQDTGKQFVGSLLEGHVMSREELAQSATQNAKKRAKNQAIGAARPYM